MLKFNEHKRGNENAEAEASLAWQNRRRERQERLERRRREAELFAHRRQMIKGGRAHYGNMMDDDALSVNGD